MHYEALVPAVEVLVRADLHLQLLKQSLVCTLTLGVHGSTHIIQNAHDPHRVLGISQVNIISWNEIHCQIYDSQQFSKYSNRNSPLWTLLSHIRFCCWSTQLVSIWFLPVHTLPVKRKGRNANNPILRTLRKPQGRFLGYINCAADLLRLQSELNKNLLKLLVHKVYAELLESILLYVTQIRRTQKPAGLTAFSLFQ